MEPVNKNPWVAVPLGYDFNPNHSGVGLGTTLRLQCLVHSVRRYGYNVPHVITSAGFPPLKIRSHLQNRTLAEMMQDWLIREGTFERAQLLRHNDSSIWTSAGELRAAIELIRAHRLTQNMLVVSSWNHVPRLWIYLRILTAFKPGWHVRFAFTFRHTVNIGHELMGTMKYLSLAFSDRSRVFE